MTAAPEVNRLYAKARKLVHHCERCQRLLRTVLEWADLGIYDPVADVHAIRLPGEVVRTIRGLLEPTTETAPPAQPGA